MDDTNKLADMKISVIIPTFNREKTIKRCLDSVVNQTMPPFEIIVVDDGSVDGTIKILEGYPCRYLRIIRQNHKGAQAARNLGIINAKGNYIAFLDSDDEWLPYMLEKAAEYISKEKEECVTYSNCYTFQENKRRLWKLPEIGSDAYSFLLMHQGPMFQSMLVRKELLLKIGMLDENVVAYQEWDTAIRLAENVRFIHVREPLFIYHLHSGDTISKSTEKGIAGYRYVIIKHQKEIIRQHGIRGMNLHYKNLFRQCVQCKDRQIFTIASEAVCINIVYGFRKLAKKRK